MRRFVCSSVKGLTLEAFSGSWAKSKKVEPDMVGSYVHNVPACMLCCRFPADAQAERVGQGISFRDPSFSPFLN